LYNFAFIEITAVGTPVGFASEKNRLFAKKRTESVADSSEKVLTA
jgi:hypothetical protein